MARRLFYRNVQASGHLDAFLVSAVFGLLAVRLYLHLTNYPALGSGGLHIAHMLWGGLLMMTAIIMLVSYLGTRIQRIAAIIGGLGFGVFIDELGKFITSNNDYFFQPTIGIIYAIFVVLYLTFNFLSRDYQRLSSREYQLNALVHIQEAIHNDMDMAEKERAATLLEGADSQNYITKALRKLLDQANTVPSRKPTWPRKLLNVLDNKYQQFWLRSTSAWRVKLFFLAEAAVFLLAVLYAAWENIADVTDVLGGDYSYSKVLMIAELVSAGVAAAFVIVGVIALRRSRLRAFEIFRRATLINIFLTEFFVFSREQLRAFPGFMFNLAILLLISYVIHQEVRTRRVARPKWARP